MTNLDWQEMFHGGSTKLDAEHQRQVELIRQMIGRCKPTMTELLGHLYVSYTKHFALEEAIMRAQCHDGYDAHQADHQRLLHEITAMLFHCRSDKRHDNAQVARVLASSFRAHFVNYDRQLQQQANTLQKPHHQRPVLALPRC